MSAHNWATTEFRNDVPARCLANLVQLSVVRPMFLTMNRFWLRELLSWRLNTAGMDIAG
jgi:hypothetical protein